MAVSETLQSTRIRRFRIQRSGRSKLPRRADVQGLRAVAVIMVVAFHAGLPVYGGFAGVDVFFVISGFVITAMLRREFTSTGRISLRGFYARRVRRLLPALAAVTVVTLALAVAIQPPIGPQQQSAQTGLATSLFFANFQIYNEGAGYFSTNSILNPFLHMWSLGVEEQFYFFFPTFLLVMWMATRRWKRWNTKLSVLAIGMVSLVSLAACVRLTSQGETQTSLAFYSSPTRVWEFGAGALVAVLANRLARFSRHVGLVVAALGMAMLFASCRYITSGDGFPGYIALLPVMGCTLAIVGGTIGNNLVSRALSIRPLTFIGDISYGWYLWHWPAVVFSRELWPGNSDVIVAASAFALVPAWISFRFLEEPLRKSRSFSGRKTLALGAICILAPALLSVGVLTAADRGWGRSENVAFAEARDERSLGREIGCIGFRVADKSYIQSKCVWQAPDSKGWMLLAGDSHADHLSNGMVMTAQKLGFDLRQSTGSRCSFSESASSETSLLKNCGDLYRWTMDMALSSPKPSLVVISNSMIGRLSDAKGTSGEDPAQAWMNGLRTTLQTLNNADIPVLLVHDIPQMGKFLEPCRYGSIVKMQCGLPEAKADAAMRAGRTVEEGAIAGLSMTSSLDLDSTFCRDGWCSPIVDGQMLYLDNGHLNGTGSRFIAPQLETAITRALGDS